MTETSPAPRDAVRAALQRLINHGLTPGVEVDDIVPRGIQDSWRRSIASHVDPAGQPAVATQAPGDDLLHEGVYRVMDRWHGSLSNTRTSLLLGNSQGRIVWRRTIDARDRPTLDAVGAIEGADFSESRSGTNGLGTAIEGRSPILVRGSEHFLESLRGVACSAAPVVHPLTGRIVGSVSLTASEDQANEYMVSVVRRAAQEIEEALLETADSRDVSLARAFRQARCGRRGVLVMNQDAVMSDLPALARLDPEMQAQIWDQLIRGLGLGEQRSFDFPESGVTGTVKNVGIGSDPILELRLASSSPTPTTTTPQLGGSTEATDPAPPGQADASVAEWWVAMNRAARHLPGELEVPMPRGSDGDEWIRAWSGRTGRLARGLLTSPEGAPLSEPRHLHRDLPAFPSLRRRRSELADLARAAYRGPAPAPRFTAEALSSLLRWHWPGDVAELEQLVNHLPRRMTSPWVVDAEDLPLRFMTAPRRPLTRWEQSERDSVLDALTEARGNKSEAAALLGIGRTTLYRKLRSLSIDWRQVEALT
ncbi:helix-turn-helix domain-containing protein [Nesterenkonia sp. CF4.4]|uniref:helix-turn-helix domain-containing protein n=1 Tax=Nesterenkonia sp. CF4.4 TaxID=3373079 RepID=UPI003EE45E41